MERAKQFLEKYDLYFYGLLLYCFSLPISISGVEIAKTFCLIVWIANLVIFKREDYLQFNKYRISLILLLFAITVSTFYSLGLPSFNEAVSRYFVYLSQLFLAYTLLTMTFDEKKIMYLVLAIFIGALVEAVYINSIFFIDGGNRIGGFLGYPNYAGQVFGMTFPLFISLILYKKIRWKYKSIFIFLIVIIASGVVFTGTRTAYVSIALTTGIFGILMLRDRPVILWSIIIGFVLFIFGMLHIFPELSKRFTEGSLYFGFHSRFMLWETSINAGLTEPFLGIGPAELNTYFREHFFDTFVNLYSYDSLGHFHAHNNFVDIFAKFGIFGTIIVFVLHYFMLHDTIKYRKFIFRKKNIFAFGFLMTILSGLIIGMFDYTIFGATSGHVFWLAFGILFSNSYIESYSKKNHLFLN